MTFKQQPDFKQYIAQRIANLKKLSREKKESLESMVEEIFGREVVDVEIKVPLHGNFVNIRESIILGAKKENKLLRVTVPNGSALWDPDEWLNGAQITFQKFNYDTPMRLYGREVFRS